MSVVIRLQRAGGRNAPCYRVVACDSRMARDGRFIEKVGYYDPKKSPAEFHLEVSRIHEWVANGARVSPAVAQLLKRAEQGDSASGKADPIQADA